MRLLLPKSAHHTFQSIGSALAKVQAQLGDISEKLKCCCQTRHIFQASFLVYSRFGFNSPLIALLI